MNAHTKIDKPPPGDGDDAFRASVVGASEVAALFDASPWLTRFELWHRKNGTIATPEFGGNERIEWGIRLERPIIEAACERYGYQPIETPRRLANGKGLGGHPDQLVTDKGEKVVLEVKTADWLVAKKWGDEPPLHYLLQNMSYQGLAGCVRGDMIVLVGGNELRRFQYDFRPAIYADIERRVEEFWDSVRANKPPKPDYSRDGGTIAGLYNDPADTLIDLRRDNRMPALAQEYLDAKAWEKKATAAVDAAKAEIIEKLGNNAAAMVDGYSVKASLIAGAPDRVITKEMVGEVIKGRKPSRRLYIKEI